MENRWIRHLFGIKKKIIEGNLICIEPEGFESSMVNWNANAKLISSAPEMFEMLKRMLNNDDWGIEDYLEIEQLLTKITE